MNGFLVLEVGKSDDHHFRLRMSNSLFHGGEHMWDLEILSESICGGLAARINHGYAVFTASAGECVGIEPTDETAAENTNFSHA
jgi:hypothetical protein